ncbi:hypothetical protein A4X13_0g7440 [Tilletia indica]|uniref:Uncharacterized protein n=1 Tax=Tilletia indica TaxID=43049 RepID=A0A177TJ23_9BASI|nr:hypothetical protein A4X13_0g7440 [Tilletia indica]
MLEEWKAWRARSREDLEEKSKEYGRENTMALPSKELHQSATEEVQEWIEEVIEEKEKIRLERVRSTHAPQVSGLMASSSSEQSFLR